MLSNLYKFVLYENSCMFIIPPPPFRHLVNSEGELMKTALTRREDDALLQKEDDVHIIYLYF